eukprot:1145040-Pelagomonas_calceolata.AAC.5
MSLTEVSSTSSRTSGGKVAMREARSMSSSAAAPGKGCVWARAHQVSKQAAKIKQAETEAPTKEPFELRVHNGKFKGWRAMCNVPESHDAHYQPPRLGLLHYFDAGVEVPIPDLLVMKCPF